MVVRTVYHEISGDSAQALELNDSGTLVIDSTRFSYKTAPDRPLIGVDGFRGDLALTTGLLMPVNSKHPASIRIRGRGDACNVLCLGNLFWAPDGMVKADAVWKNEAKASRGGGPAVVQHERAGDGRQGQRLREGRFRPS